MNTETQDQTTTAADPATPATEAKPAKVAAPKLTLTHDGKTQPLLKYPFPTKAAKFAVKVNGHPAEAATTAGRGKAYTYILFNSTSFYVPGLLPVDAELSINFPESYKFDDKVAPRISNYKPKKPKAAKADEAAASTADEAGGTGEAQAEGSTMATTDTAGAEVAPDAPKGARRPKK